MTYSRLIGIIKNSSKDQNHKSEIQIRDAQSNANLNRYDRIFQSPSLISEKTPNRTKIEDVINSILILKVRQILSRKRLNI